MNYHPRLHFIVPGGAIGLDGKSWLSSRIDFLIPVLAASVLFQAKYKWIMDRIGLLAEIPTEVWEKAWNVNCKAVGDGGLALRFLQHVLPSGFQKVLHFGFAHPRAKTNWEWLSMLMTVTLNMVYVLTVAAKPLGEKRTLKCSECGAS